MDSSAAAWWLLLGGLVCGLCTAVLGVWVAAVGACPGCR